MKTALMTVILVGFFSCKSEKEKLKSFLPGTYARRVTHEFSTGNDTLHILQLKGAVYLIERKVSFQRIKNGRPLPVERKRESWTAIFDVKTGIMRETKRGRIIFFDQDGNRLLVGSSVYQKVN